MKKVYNSPEIAVIELEEDLLAKTSTNVNIDTETEHEGEWDN